MAGNIELDVVEVGYCPISGTVSRQERRFQRARRDVDETKLDELGDKGRRLRGSRETRVAIDHVAN